MQPNMWVVVHPPHSKILDVLRDDPVSIVFLEDGGRPKTVELWDHPGLPNHS